jgi:hypothetical protein
MLRTRGFTVIPKLNTAYCVNLIILIMAGNGHAAMIGTATLVRNPPGMPFNAPDASMPFPYQAWQIGISTTAGELIGAVDVQITGNALHQKWTDTDDDGATNPSPNSPAVGNVDSHLQAPAGSPFGSGPTETNTKAGSPLTSTANVTEFGFGNLSGSWGILVPGQTAALAYIVFDPANIPQMDIRIKAATPTGAPILTLGGSDTLTGSLDCLACVPPVAGDDVIDNVNANVPGLVERQLTIQSYPIGGAVTLSNFAFNSFTPPPGGSGAGPANPASLDSATQKFTWNTVGSPLGSYKWTYTAQNSFGSDSGSITVNITIPESATCSLAGLTLVGLGFVRRRAG